jgi:flagellar hook-associated protein 2
LVDTSGQFTGNLKVENFNDGTTTADKLFGSALDVAANSVNSGDLHLRVIGLDTQLSDLNGGSGVSQGQFTITDSAGKTGTVNVDSSVKTIGDVIQAINLLSNDVLAEINQTGDGIIIQNTASGAGTLTIAEKGSSTASDLNLLKTATIKDSTQVIDGSTTRTIDFSTADPKVIGLTTKLSELNSGSGVARGKFSITNSAGSAGTIDLTDTSIQTIGDLLTAVNALGINVTASINDTKDGIIIRDTSNGAGRLTVKEAGSTTAQNLNILGSGEVVYEGGQQSQVIDGKHATYSLQQLRDKINNLKAGVTASIV